MKCFSVSATQTYIDECLFVDNPTGTFCHQMLRDFYPSTRWNSYPDNNII